MSRITVSAREYQGQVEQWARKSRRKAAFPRRLKARLIALHYFQMAFEPGATYAERQVNFAIEQGNLFEVDHVQVRRYLVDYGMLDWSADGTSYTLSQAYLSLADWDPAISQVGPGQ